MQLRAVGLSDRGRSREKNDDHYCLGPFVEQGVLTSLAIDEDSAWFHEYGLLAVVADGMGGYAGGEVASRVALETLSALYYGDKRRGCTRDELTAGMVRYLEQTQRVLAKTLERTSDLADAGTTVAGIALMPPDILVVFHAGDSRVLRASGGFVRALTVDHTPIAPDIESGRISEEEAVGMLDAQALTCSLGLKGDHRASVNGDDNWVSGDSFLLCTDGFHGLCRGLPRAALRDAVRAGGNPDVLVTTLVRDAIAADGRDNATLVYVSCH